MRRLLIGAMAVALGFGVYTDAQVPKTYSSTDAPASPQLTAGERADIFLARREYPEAISFLKDAVKEHPTDASLFNRLAIAYQQSQNLGQAEKNYKKALKLDRTSPVYRNNLGTVYFMRRKYKNASKEFGAAIQLDHTVAAYYVNLGGSEFAQKHFQPALAAYRQALRLDPNALFPTNGPSPVLQDVTGSDTPRFHYDLSRLFCSMGMVDDALHQFRQAYDQHYRGLKASLTDPEFAPLRARPEYRALMGLPPLPPHA